MKTQYLVVDGWRKENRFFHWFSHLVSCSCSSKYLPTHTQASTYKLSGSQESKQTCENKKRDLLRVRDQQKACTRTRTQLAGLRSCPQNFNQNSQTHQKIYWLRGTVRDHRILNLAWLDESLRTIFHPCLCPLSKFHHSLELQYLKEEWQGVNWCDSTCPGPPRVSTRARYHSAFGDGIVLSFLNP